jgi:DNA-binding response OmpR family regulator
MLMNAFFKIAAIGDTLSIERLCSSMAGSAIIATHLTEIPEAIELLKRESFDVVVVDSLYEEAQLACKSIAEISLIPIALLVKDRETNWDRICRWNVDGYVPEESGHIEMLARIRAISRRKSFKSTTQKVEIASGDSVQLQR